MLVVDRREDQFAFSPGANRAEVQAEVARSHPGPSNLESTAVPALVEIERCKSDRNLAGAGVWCVTETPGSEVLVSLLLERVWGVVVHE
jgi:hypothetical protein